MEKQFVTVRLFKGVYVIPLQDGRYLTDDNSLEAIFECGDMLPSDNRYTLPLLVDGVWTFADALDFSECDAPE